MTDYTPFQEPFTNDVSVLSRRTWEELRRIGVSVNQLARGGTPEIPPELLELEQRVTDNENDIAQLQITVQAHETRLNNLEYNMQEVVDVINFLLDGTHAQGRVASRYRHAPSTNPTNTNTRLTFDTTDSLSLMTQVGDYGFTPLYEGDYFILATLRFAPDSSGDEWNLRFYENGSPIGDTFTFKPDEVSGGEQVMMTFQGAGLFQVGDTIDTRLWPNSSGKGGWVETYTYSMIGLGLIDPDWQPTY